jgi:hypothetical protein
VPRQAQTGMWATFAACPSPPQPTGTAAGATGRRGWLT